MAQLLLSPCASPGARRRSDGSVRECLFFPVLERNEQERLEALVRRRGGGAAGAGGGGERHRTAAAAGEANTENRPKRWTWGGPPGGGEGNLKTPPSHSNELPAAASPSQSRNVCDLLAPPTSDPPITKRLSSSSATLHSPERVSPVPQRAFRGSPHRKSVTAAPDDNKGTAQVEKGPAPCAPDSPMRRVESPTTPTRTTSLRAQSKSLGTPKRVRSSKSRAQSPCSPGQYPPSPVRQRASDGPQDRGGPPPEGRGPNGPPERRGARPDPPERKIPKSNSRDLGTESPGTPTGRYVAGTTDAEEASRLLAERRRLARVQKEQEEKLRQEEERLREEEELVRREEAREQQERAAQQAEEERERREEERRSREEEERRMKERRWKDMQDQLDREREEACQRAQREAERRRQEREVQHLQEEQERLQRKKRIEEIMKRTRKNEDSPAPAQDVSGVRGQADGALEDDAGVDLAPVSVATDAPSLITLGPLETRSCGDELSDGVQSMDVSPVSRDELAPEFSSPLGEAPDGVSMSHARTLERLLDLTGPRPSFPAPPTTAVALGDLNKNLLIQDFCGSASFAAGPARPDSAPQLIHGLSAGPGVLDIQ